MYIQHGALFVLTSLGLNSNGRIEKSQVFHSEKGASVLYSSVNLLRNMVKYTIMYTPKEGRGYNPRQWMAGLASIEM